MNEPATVRRPVMVVLVEVVVVVVMVVVVSRCCSSSRRSRRVNPEGVDKKGVGTGVGSAKKSSAVGLTVGDGEGSLEPVGRGEEVGDAVGAGEGFLESDLPVGRGEGAGDEVGDAVGAGEGFLEPVGSGEGYEVPSSFMQMQ